METFQGKENPFFAKNNEEETITIFLEDSNKIGSKAEQITTLHKFWLPSFIEKLQSI